MKQKNRLVSLLFLSLLLSACSKAETSSLPFSEDVSLTASSSDNNSSKTEEEKQDYSDYPYLSSLEKDKKTDWKGKWIFASSTPKDSYYAFRKTFTLDSLPEKALLSLSADSKANVFVNGKLAVLDAPSKRGATALDCYYQDYDILSYLKRGENLLTFVVTYFGKSGNSYLSSGQGGLLFDLDLKDQVISSDSSLKVKRLDAYRRDKRRKAHTLNSLLAENDIYYDARAEDGDYTSLAFDDSSWENATVIARPGYQPFGETYLTDIPAFSFSSTVEEMTPENYVLGTKLTQDTTLTFDLKEDQQFLPYFELDSEEEGKVITFYTDSVTTQGMNSFMDDYTTKKGKQSYQQYYWRSGAKFVMEVPKGITLEKVGYLSTGYQTDTVGSFISDDTSLNTLWKKADNTLHICMRDTFMDCPDRERSPYTGDSANQISESLYALDEDGWKMIKKMYRTLPGWVKSDHVIPTRSPSLTTNENPMQNLAYMIVSREYYLATGDEETLKMVYPIFLDYLDLWEFNEDGSVVFRSGSFPWIDWGNGYDASVMENAWYAYALKTMILLGKEAGLLSAEKETSLSSRYEKIKSAFRKFEVTGGYSSAESGALDDRANALAVLSGLASEEKKEEIVSTLSTVKQASPYMEKYVLEALCQLGRTDLAKERMLSRYADMISLDYSTLWESWDSDFSKGTRNHGWSGGPLNIMSRHFAGIEATKKGYESYKIQPSALFSSLSASAETPKGLLSFSLRKEESKTTIIVDALDSEGTLVLSSSFGSSFTLDQEAITPNKEEDSAYSIPLRKGKHTIVITKTTDSAS